MGRVVDMSGKKIGKLLVIKREKTKGHGAMWLCKCDCGKEVITRGDAFRKKNPTESCGCLNKGGTTHGYGRQSDKNPTYITWIAMRSRCNTVSNIGYSTYGGRGIAFCKRWNSFENFLEDMGEKPKGKDISLDRIDSNGNYCKENCRWATRTQQNRNKRDCRYITYNGETKTITDWAEKMKIVSREAIYHRLNVGWDIEKALTTPSIRS